MYTSVEGVSQVSKFWGKRYKQAVMLHIIVFLKYLGSYGNEASLQKIARAMGISKGAINDCVMQVSQAILKLQKKVIRWQMTSNRSRLYQGLNKHMFLSVVLA